MSTCGCCGGESTAWRPISDWQTRRCRDCGSAWLDPMPTQNQLDVFYARFIESYPQRSVDHADSAQLEVLHSSVNIRRLRRIAKLQDAVGGRQDLLDVGCATGQFLSDAHMRGFSVFGTELSEPEAAQARAKTPTSSVQVANLWDCGFADSAFGVVTAWDLFEHVPDQRRLIEEIHRVLAPHGILAISTINIGALNQRIFGHRWGFFIPPEHVHFYSMKGLVALLESSGFSILHKRTLLAPQLTLHALAGLLRRQEPEAAAAGPPSFGALRMKRALDAVVNPIVGRTDLGDIPEIYARRL
ncbi:MAG: 2-polyprenyl-3-methyl-5-hydroxy-6-metoxy-1,4-benzoquinol methylase [Candidatus Poriferisodalaceae bacterium]|jgi:2-polyprenyl-3-methyl-5-hydroxy-6-metoxy-1,4-benzoquinol methylase